LGRPERVPINALPGARIGVASLPPVYLRLMAYRIPRAVRPKTNPYNLLTTPALNLRQIDGPNELCDAALGA